MKGHSSTTIIGNIGSEPQSTFTPQGNQVTTFSVAVNEKYTNKQGEAVETVEWFAVVCWRRLAEIAAEYLKKGSPVFVEGKMRTRTWDKDDGTKGYRTELVARDLILLGSKPGAPAPTEDDQPAAAPAPGPTEITDEDIPF